MPIRSLELGLSGQADCVEYLPDGSLYPVEYKRGKPKKDRSDEVQLCAQALCLEEMLNSKIEKGALYYGTNRRRYEIIFSEDLRNLVKKISEELHLFIDKGITPPAKYESRCDACSLMECCQPKILNRKSHIKKYIDDFLGENEDETDSE